MDSGSIRTLEGIEVINMGRTVKKALAPMGDNPDPERKEKPDILCPVEE